MKITLPASNFVFTPSTNTISFTPMNGAFVPYRLLAITNITTGKLIYAVASQPAGYNGTFSTNIYPDDTLTYVSSNAGQSASDIIEVLYDSDTATQYVAGNVSSYILESGGNTIGGVSDPSGGGYKLKTASNTYAADGTPILTTTDPISGGDGLNIHLQSSAYGGELGQPLPSAAYGYQSALSMGFLNGSVLVAPKMDPVTNELIVQGTFAPAALQDVNLTQISGVTPSVDQGSSDTGTLRVAANNYTSSGFGLEYGNGQIGAGAQRMALGDYAFSGPSGVSVSGANLLTNTVSSVDFNGYRYFAIQIVSTATAGTFIFETSNDDINWQPLPVSNQSLTTGVIITSAITATASSYIYVGTMTGRYLRIRIVTTLTGGSAQAVCRFSQVAPLANNVTISSGSASTVAPNIDVLGSAVSGSRYNQIEIDFNTVPGATLITNTTAGSGTITATNGHTLYATSSGATSSAKGVSVGIVQYRAANELYSYFSAAFTTSAGRNINSYQRIGIYDTTNGFFIGYNGTNFGVTKRTNSSDTFINRTAWNGDLLDGNPASKFTRNNIPEAINLAVSNLFRIRFAWLGSACILFDVFSPDGIWVNYHTIKQPNSDFNPSLTIPNLPMTIDCAKTGSGGAEVLTIATACWAGGTTSEYSPITSTLTDNSLAGLTRSVITGVTTGGGGGYINVKVNPSGALVTDSTISGTVATNISQYGGTSTTLGQKAMTASMPVVISSDQSSVNTLLPDLFLTGQSGQAALINNILPQTTASATATDASGYRTAYVQVVASAGISAGAIIFEVSNDNVNFQATPYFNQSLITGATVSGSTALLANTQVIYALPITARYIRLRISTAVVGGTIQAFTKLSQAVYTPAVTTVTQPTAAQLNATVSGSLTSAGTVTQATPANLNCTALVSAATLASTVVTDMNAVSTVASGNNAATGTAILSTQAHSFQITNVITTGTGSIDVVIQEAYDGSGTTTWVDVYHLDRVTGVGTVRQQIPSFKVNGDRIRYSWTVTGTLTTATMTVTRIPRQVTSGNLRRIYDRTLVPSTLGSSTASLFTEGCEYTDLIVNMGAGGTAPVIQLQGSEDNTNWYNIGTALTATVGATTALSLADGSIPKFCRATVATAGAGSTLNYVAIKAKGAS